MQALQLQTKTRNHKVETIARYVGWRKASDNYWLQPFDGVVPGNMPYLPTKTPIKSERIFFDCNYEWQLQVVDFIEAKGYSFHIYKNSVWVTKDGENGVEVPIPVYCSSNDKHTAILETILSFIDWEKRDQDIRR